jgi:hypothetical protein
MSIGAMTRERRHSQPRVSDAAAGQRGAEPADRGVPGDTPAVTSALRDTSQPLLLLLVLAIAAGVTYLTVRRIRTKVAIS